MKNLILLFIALVIYSVSSFGQAILLDSHIGGRIDSTKNEVQEMYDHLRNTNIKKCEKALSDQYPNYDARDDEQTCKNTLAGVFTCSMSCGQKLSQTYDVPFTWTRSYNCKENYCRKKLVHYFSKHNLAYLSEFCYMTNGIEKLNQYLVGKKQKFYRCHELKHKDHIVSICHSLCRKRR